LPLNPSQHLSFVESPIFAQSEAGDPVKAAGPSPVIDPGRGYLQYFSHLLNAEEVATWLQKLNDS